MPFISCEDCDFQGNSKNSFDRLKEVLEHEREAHRRYQDKEWLLEKDMEEIEDDKRSSDR